MNNTSTNDITGDAIKTKPSIYNYRSGWDKVFGKPIDTKLLSCIDEDVPTGEAKVKDEYEVRWASGRVTGTAAHQEHPLYKESFIRMINLGLRHSRVFLRKLKIQVVRLKKYLRQNKQK